MRQRNVDVPRLCPAAAGLQLLEETLTALGAGSAPWTKLERNLRSCRTGPQCAY
eukprot:COSAG03_NODE_472_length_7647_cov_6.909910_6_plen_54_part_00